MLNYTTVTGTFEDGSGAPLSGNVTFTPSQAVYASGIPLVTPGTPVVAEIAGGQLLNASGGPLTLLATDNTGLSLASGTGFWFWTVSLQFGQVSDGWSFFLPHAPSPVDLYATKNSGVNGAAYLPLSGGTMAGFLAPKVITLAQSGGNVPVGGTLGNVFLLTLTASGWVIQLPTGMQDGEVFRVRTIQDATGGRTVTWASGWDWGSAGGTPNSAPTLSTAPNATDILGFEWDAANSKANYLSAPFPQGF